MSLLTQATSASRILGSWDKKQHENPIIKACLDRSLDTREFLEIFDEVKVVHTETTESDHCTLLIECTLGGYGESDKEISDMRICGDVIQCT